MKTEFNYRAMQFEDIMRVAKIWCHKTEQKELINENTATADYYRRNINLEDKFRQVNPNLGSALTMCLEVLTGKINHSVSLELKDTFNKNSGYDVFQKAVIKFHEALPIK